MGRQNRQPRDRLHRHARAATADHRLRRAESSRGRSRSAREGARGGACQRLEQLRVPAQSRGRISGGGRAALPRLRRVRRERHRRRSGAPARMGDGDRHGRPRRPRPRSLRAGVAASLRRQTGVHRSEMPDARLVLSCSRARSGRRGGHRGHESLDARGSVDRNSRAPGKRGLHRRRGARTRRPRHGPADRLNFQRRRFLARQAAQARVDPRDGVGERRGRSDRGARRARRRPARGSARSACGRAVENARRIAAGPRGRQRSGRQRRGRRGGEGPCSREGQGARGRGGAAAVRRRGRRRPRAVGRSRRRRAKLASRRAP